jgi:S1-C subfamily serine protease
VQIPEAGSVAQNRVVTNNHVVSGCTKAIQVRYPDGRPYTATISGQDATNDLVLLHTEMPNLSVATFRFQPLLGEAVAPMDFLIPASCLPILHREILPH